MRRLAIVCLKNGSPQRETILLLNGLADDDEQDADLRKTAKAVAAALTRKGRGWHDDSGAAMGAVMMRSDRTRRRDHGLALRLGDDAARLRDARGARRPFEQQVVSAHRTPDLLFEYAGSAEERGLQVLIAGAGGAALAGWPRRRRPARARRAGRVEDAEGDGLAALDRADAGRRARWARWRSAARAP